MSVRRFAMIFGLIFLVAGVLGFVPALRTTPVEAPELAVTAGFGFLFGLFAVNVLHNLAHIAIGIWGVIAYRSFAAARIFARALAIIYAVLTVFGLIPGLNTLFGLAPLFGHDIWLHAVTAVIAAYFGWRVPEPATATPGSRS